MPYISNTDEDRKKMFDAIGVKSFDDLIKSIPGQLRLKRPLAIDALSEMEILAEFQKLASENKSNSACFAGGGVYDHFIPSALSAIICRPEFMTAYTPYQPEVAQGTLQVIYEFQTHICRLTGMEVANASMYDGASAAAEAVLLAVSATKRDKVIISASVNPLYREVISTILAPREIEIVTIPVEAGITDLSFLENQCDDKTACFLVGQPNFFGLLEEIDVISDIAHKSGAKLIMAIDPIAQALLKTPEEYGADIVVGEGQPLGIPLSFGGPLLGFFAIRKELIRRLPGRLAARTKDVDGKTGYVLTLQTREQHIRRDKATSNICTNQALCATAASVYMSLMGKNGLKQVALLSAEKAKLAASQIFSIDGFEPYFDGAFVREFAVRTPRPAAQVIDAMLSGGVLAGIDAGRWYPGLDDCLIIATTEKRSDGDISKLVEGLREMASSGVLSGMQ